MTESNTDAEPSIGETLLIVYFFLVFGVASFRAGLPAFAAVLPPQQYLPEMVAISLYLAFVVAAIAGSLAAAAATVLYLTAAWDWIRRRVA